MVTLERVRPGLKEHLQQTLPNLLTVEQVLPGEKGQDIERIDLRALSLVDAYRSYLVEEKGQEKPDQLVALFQALHDEGSA